MPSRQHVTIPVMLSLLTTAGAAPRLLAFEHTGATSKEVQYDSHGVTVHATLSIPKGTAPFPGVVIVHGSGSSDRSNPWTAAYAEGLVARGIAVLHPDKRGSGKSGGKWQTSDFLLLADDAVAGVELLRAQPEVDATNIGVIGFSQGGDIVPAAASRSKHVAFAIDVSGSVVPILDQVFDEVVLMAEREGLTPSQIELLRSVNDAGMHFLHDGRGWNHYMEALREAKRRISAKSEAVAGFPTEQTDPAWDFLRTIGDFDPMNYWKKLNVPSLFVYGGRDTQVRVSRSIDRILAELGSSKLNYALVLFSKNGHALYRDDELDLIGRWIRDHGAP